MKGVRTAMGIAVLLLLTLPSFGTAQRVGEMAPEIMLVDAHGEPLRLSSFRGTPVLLNFWASWCVPCQTELPLMFEVAETLNKAGPRVVFYLVNRDVNPEDGKVFLGDLAGAFAATYSPTREQRFRLREQGVEVDTAEDVSRRYRVLGLPTTVLIGADGTVRAVYPGEVDLRRVEELLSLVGLNWTP